MKLIFSNKKVMKRIVISIICSVICGMALVLFALFFVKMQMSTYFLKIFETKTLSQLEIYHKNQVIHMQEDLQNIMDVVTEFSQSQSVRNAFLSGNIVAGQSLIEQQRKINKYLQLWTIVDKTGKIVTFSTDMPGFQTMLGQNLSDRDYFKKVMATKKPYMTPVLVDIVTNNLFIDFSAPVFNDNNQITYVLNGNTPINYLRSQLKLKSNVAYYYNVILDKNGNIILEDGDVPTSIINLKDTDRIANLLLRSSQRITDEEINYKGETVFAMGDAIQISGDTDNKLYLISYFPKSQFDKQNMELEAEINRIFFGVGVLTLICIIAMWGLNYWLALQYINEREKIIEITK